MITYYVLLVLIVVLSFLLARRLDRTHRGRIALGLCEYCKKYIQSGDRERRYQTRGGLVMCPHCWEFTRVDENVRIEAMEEPLVEV